jgi:hypothetical protein
VSASQTKGRSPVEYEKFASKIERIMASEELSNEEAVRHLCRLATELAFAGIPNARPGFITNMERTVRGLLEGSADGLRY